jgi:two-component system cell cycle response regulator DivK
MVIPKQHNRAAGTVQVRAAAFATQTFERAAAAVYYPGLSPLSRGGAVTMRSPSVLLIDPDIDNRLMYAEYLRARGMTVVTAAATDDAWERAGAADVIVTGIRVAGPFDGIELVRRLRASKRTACMPIIVLTACAFEPDQQRALSAGCDRFLPKPCLPGQLEAEIRKLLALRRVKARRSLTASSPARRRKPRAS